MDPMQFSFYIYNCKCKYVNYYKSFIIFSGHLTVKEVHFFHVIDVSDFALFLMTDQQMAEKQLSEITKTCCIICKKTLTEGALLDISEESTS